MAPATPALRAAAPDAPPAPLVRALVARGLVAPGARWRVLPGGRVNRVWAVDRPTPRVVKLFAPGGARVLFANDPAAEAAALHALAPLGLAPEPLAMIAAGEAGTAGPALVMARIGEGRPAALGPEAVGRLLARLHAIAPWPGLAEGPLGAGALGAEAQRLAAALGRPAPRIADPGEPPPRAVPTHGDPVPANILGDPARPVLVDWQCAALADPLRDLAIALSPAMRRIYGAQPWTAAEAEALLAAYAEAAPDGAVTCRRYRRLRPLLHLRVMLHCLARAAEGGADAGEWRDAARLERPLAGAAPG